MRDAAREGSFSASFCTSFVCDFTLMQLQHSLGRPSCSHSLPIVARDVSMAAMVYHSESRV